MSIATKEDPVIAATNTATSSKVHQLYTYSLGLEGRIQMQFRFQLANTDYDSYIIRVTWNGETYDYTGEDLIPTAGYAKFVTAIFDQMEATDMRDTVTVELYQNGKLVSETYTASIEGCAKMMIDKGSYVDLLKAMLKYGDAAVKALAN